MIMDELKNKAIELEIERGYGRLGTGKNKDGKWQCIILVSKNYLEPGSNFDHENPEDLQPVFFINIKTEDQALAYSRAFASLAERIKEEKETEKK